MRPVLTAAAQAAGALHISLQPGGCTCVQDEAQPHVADHVHHAGVVAPDARQHRVRHLLPAARVPSAERALVCTAALDAPPLSLHAPAAPCDTPMRAACAKGSPAAVSATSREPQTCASACAAGWRRASAASRWPPGARTSSAACPAGAGLRSDCAARVRSVGAARRHRTWGSAPCSWPWLGPGGLSSSPGDILSKSRLSLAATQPAKSPLWAAGSQTRPGCALRHRAQAAQPACLCSFCTGSWGSMTLLLLSCTRSSALPFCRGPGILRAGVVGPVPSVVCWKQGWPAGAKHARQHPSGASAQGVHAGVQVIRMAARGPALAPLSQPSRRW